MHLKCHSEMGLFKRVLSSGVVSEPQAPPSPEDFLRSDLSFGSLVLRHVDAGSCNGCEIELLGCFAPNYDLESYCVSLTASPRHADGIVVTGVVTLNMQKPLMDAYRATPEPKIVVALGDCAINCNGLQNGYGVVGPVAGELDVDLEIPGCPPSPSEIISALRRVSKR